MNKLLLLVTIFSANAFAKPVNINNADATTISQALTGITLKQAEAIVASRIQAGDFNSVEELKRVVGIDEKTVARNKADILFANPKPRTGRYHERSRERHGHTHERPQNRN